MIFKIKYLERKEIVFIKDRKWNFGFIKKRDYIYLLKKIIGFFLVFY